MLLFERAPAGGADRAYILRRLKADIGSSFGI